jgi:hypothetical protein
MSLCENRAAPMGARMIIPTSPWTRFAPSWANCNSTPAGLDLRARSPGPKAKLGSHTDSYEPAKLAIVPRGTLDSRVSVLKKSRSVASRGRSASNVSDGAGAERGRRSRLWGCCADPAIPITSKGLGEFLSLFHVERWKDENGNRRINPSVPTDTSEIAINTPRLARVWREHWLCSTSWVTVYDQAQDYVRKCLISLSS